MLGTSCRSTFKRPKFRAIICYIVIIRLTFIQVEGMKMMARWLLGLKTDEVAAQKTFRMLNAIIDNGGDLLEEGKPNPAERAWLRLAAGCAMLKICE